MGNGVRSGIPIMIFCLESVNVIRTEVGSTATSVNVRHRTQFTRIRGGVSQSTPQSSGDSDSGSILVG